jgi:hypothetical protein
MAGAAMLDCRKQPGAALGGRCLAAASALLPVPIRDREFVIDTRGSRTDEERE